MAPRGRLIAFPALGLWSAAVLAGRSFVTLDSSAGQSPKTSHLPLQNNVLRHPSLAAHSQARSSSTRSASLVCCSAALALALVAGSRRFQASSTATRVTLADIENLQYQDVPKWFRPKISIGMARRGAMAKSISQLLEKTYFIAAFNKDGLDWGESVKARTFFPPSVIVRGLKNSLVKKAMERTPWEEFSTHLRGSNLFIFVLDDSDVKGAVQAYLKLEKEFNRKDVVAQLYEKGKDNFSFELKPLIGGCIRDDWKLIGPEEFVKLKDFPTKTELIGQIAGSIKQVTQKLAVGVKQLPQKLAVGTKKIVEKMEEEGKATVGDVVA